MPHPDILSREREAEIERLCNTQYNLIGSMSVLPLLASHEALRELVREAYHARWSLWDGEELTQEERDEFYTEWLASKDIQ